MCGIVGYLGTKDQVLDTLLSGLKRLEYRGYDSAGVAITTQNQEVFCTKEIGKIVNLESKISSQKLPKFGVSGIAHTRWATHGVPSERNAHPHSSSDGNIWLVHNGIIENYKELKAVLIKKGFTFQSQTDSEVVANLIASFYTGNLKEAILQALSKVSGAFAISVISKNEPGVLFGAKKGSPLVLGIGAGEFILASDVSAVISRTKDVIYLEDNEIVEIRGQKYTVTNFLDEQLAKKIERVEWSETDAEKDGFDHFLLKEIMEQPKSVEDSIRGRLMLDEAKIKFGGLIDVMDRIQTITKVILIGIGTSYYAARIGEMFMEEIAGISAKAEMSSEFRYKRTVLDDKTWVIAISQSGETADTIAAIEEAKNKGVLVTGIVNTVGSTIARMTDAGVYNHIGPEISVASTKAFSSQAILLLMHAILLGRSKNLSYATSQRLINSIYALPKQIENILNQHKKIAEIAKKYINCEHLMYLGRKYNYPVALEGSLKIKEISYIHAEGLSAGELKHGFIALIDQNFPTIAICPKDSVYEKMLSNIEEVKARRGRVLAIATEGDTDISELVDDVIYVPKSECEETQAILNNVPLQLLAYYCSVLRGLDVDKPRNLAKSVTVE